MLIVWQFSRTNLLESGTGTLDRHVVVLTIEIFRTDQTAGPDVWTSIFQKPSETYRWLDEGLFIKLDIFESQPMAGENEILKCTLLLRDMDVSVEVLLQKSTDDVQLTSSTWP